MAAAFGYILLTLQLVCHLVATGNSTIVDTTSGTTPAPSPRPMLALPNGYVGFLDFGVAYKIHNDELSWIDAKAKCAEEGGHLADIDSDLKPALFSNFLLRESEGKTWTGIHLVNGTWRSDRTGLPVTNLPWGVGEPVGDWGCAAMISYQANRLVDFECDYPLPFACQIRYS